MMPTRANPQGKKGRTMVSNPLIGTWRLLSWENRSVAAVGVHNTEIASFVAEIQSGCHPWSPFATIHGGPILLPYWASRARRTLADPLRVLRRGSAFSSHLLRTYLPRTGVNKEMISPRLLLPIDLHEQHPRLE